MCSTSPSKPMQSSSKSIDRTDLEDKEVHDSDQDVGAKISFFNQTSINASRNQGNKFASTYISQQNSTQNSTYQLTKGILIKKRKSIKLRQSSNFEHPSFVNVAPKGKVQFDTLIKEKGSSPNQKPLSSLTSRNLIFSINTPPLEVNRDFSRLIGSGNHSVNLNKSMDRTIETLARYANTKQLLHH